MVLSEWKVLTVGQLFDVQLGKMLNQAAKEKYPQYKYLGNSDVRWGFFDLSNLKTMYFSEKERRKFTLQVGDILLCEGGEVGRCAVWNSEVEDVYYQKALHRLRPSSMITSLYFQYYMVFINGTKLLDDFTSRTSIAHLTREKLLQLPVKVPPMSEQHEISKILSIWDKAISTTERLINNSKQQKKALMQQLLTGKKRLLDDLAKPFAGDWKEVKLENVAVIIMGSSPKSSSYNENKKGLPLIQGNADIKNRKSVPRICTSEVTKTCHPEDILLSVRAPVGTVAKSEHEACIGRGISSIKARTNYVQEYLYQWLLWFEPRWEQYSQGSTFEAINSNDIKLLHLIIPCQPEQLKIASILANADKEIFLLEQQLSYLKQEKKALMQQLLTGKRRIKVDNKEVV